MLNARLLSLLTLLLVSFSLTACRPDYPKCKETSHCSDKGEVCIDGLCKECGTDAECKEGFMCKANACVARPQCQADGDCKGGLRCKAEKCVPECTVDGECARGEKCSANKCVVAAECTTDGDCAAGKKCGPAQSCIDAPAEPKPEPKPVVDDEEARRRAALEKCELTRVQFEFNEFGLSDTARATLDKNAECLRFKKVAVTVAGHADERGTEEYNIVLGNKRANAVVRYLVQLGVAEDKIKTVSYGKEKPLDTASNEEAWAKNRRAEFIVR